MGSPAIGELVHAHAALEARPDAGAAEHLVGARADGVARGEIFGPAAGARRLDVIAVEAVEFGVQVLGQQAFLRAQLHGVGKRLLQAGQLVPRPSPASRPRAAPRTRRAAAAASSSSAAGCRRRTRANSPGSSTRRRSTRPLAGSNEQDADIDPLVAHQVRRVAHHVIGAGRGIRFGSGSFASGMAHFQLGKGWRPESRAENDQLAHPLPPLGRAGRAARPSCSYSSLYHSGGISSAISPSAALLMRCSTRPSQGSNESMPVTCS